MCRRTIAGPIDDAHSKPPDLIEGEPPMIYHLAKEKDWLDASTGGDGYTGGPRIVVTASFISQHARR
jgi:hypothetical protein